MPEISCQIEQTVPFFDVDSMHIVWHGHYVKYMEKARCALLDLIDYNYYQMEESGYFWPVIDMRIRYVKPLKFKQMVVIDAKLVDYEYGLRIDFRFTDQLTGEKLTTAYTKQVAVEKNSGEMSLLSQQILHDKIDEYLTK